MTSNLERHWGAATHNRDQVVAIRELILLISGQLAEARTTLIHCTVGTDQTKDFATMMAQRAEAEGMGRDLQLLCQAAMMEAVRAEDLLQKSTDALERMTSEATRTMGVLSDTKEALERLAIAVHAVDE